MDIYVYKSVGGRNLLLDVSGNALPIVITIFTGIKEDGLTNFNVRQIEKNSRPNIKEIRKGEVRVFFFEKNCAIHVTNITNHKQKNKTEKMTKIWQNLEEN